MAPFTRPVNVSAAGGPSSAVPAACSRPPWAGRPRPGPARTAP